MNKKSRTHSSLINSLSASVAQAISLLMSFVSRTFFIRILGEQYLGLNGLFLNILNILSFAELGIGAAITFSLYQPLASGDNDQVLALMQLYKKVYHLIALIIFLSGMLLLPFLGFFINGSTHSVGNIYFAFLLFLMNSVVSYLWNYKRSVFFADQSGYINSLNILFFQVMGQLLQIIFLLISPSYYLYLFIQIAVTILSNLQISKRADKRYPFLKKKVRIPVPKKTMSFLKKNVVGMISSKLGGIVVMGTDNILLSAFLGLSTVAVYSNYTLIMNGLTSVVNQGISAVTASIGNLRAVGNPKKEKEVFFKYSQISALVGVATSVGMVSFFSPFIRVWVGERFLLDSKTTFLIVLGFYVTQLRQSNINFTNAYGLYWEQRLKSLLEALVNLVVSLCLIIFFKLGIDAVILGNLASNLFVNAWWEPLIVLKSGLRSSKKEMGFYAKFYALELFLGGCLIFLCMSVAAIIPVNLFFIHVVITPILIIFSVIVFDLTTSKIISINFPQQSLIKRFANKTFHK
ncbi:lipopolysaccharide biosynthesis protein [Lacticaseibacillus paracasei]|uniref:lipopolysaccharide biosynthesis protein n=1 Tax=Lacticaseibacillus paracasei TaxID=1597 RepID=UPI0035C68910